MRWTTAKIRQSFLDFFAERGHTIVPSASLIPKGDPTLLFTNAGMVPFKDYFLGVRTPEHARVADCQKCLRISGKHNDLEAVGRDTYHHTFFEMLGNWSFGDYYKEEAIRWHWELITRVWGVDPKLLYATVHNDDKEAEDIWLKMGVLPRERILRFADKDNFWEMAETGPSGPNSEISIDRGQGACNPERNHPGQKCFVNVDGCERYIELGNLVFIQYNREASGALTPLPRKHVDTGSGLERIAAALQSIEAGKILGNYDIDLFKDIIDVIEQIVMTWGNHQRYGSGANSDVSYRAIADHARSISFLIAEGLRPGRDGRQYVLRRLIRRAVWHARNLQVQRPDFLQECCARVVSVMGGAYPELTNSEAQIKQLVGDEDTQFSSTIEQGRIDLENMILGLQSKKQNVLPGDLAFYLYDSRGFPLDLTQSILTNKGMTVDQEKFDRLMEEQRERGRASRSARGFSASELAKNARDLEDQASKFVGYHRYEAESEILAAPNDPDGKCLIITAETPFYPEGGGQVGDRGVIEFGNDALVEVLNTIRHGPAIVHVGRVLRGKAGDFARGARVTLKVDRLRRDAAMLNHSATHILHYALRDVLGSSVHQAGSLVDPDKLRFDFAHQGPVKDDALATIEEEINARIRENVEVTVEEMAYNDAIKAGALAFFGDKYGDRVRVVRMGDFSVELCGGTHISRTGDVGMFKLEAESGVAAGVRRIEAVTGQGALETIRKREKILEEIGAQLGARDSAAVERLEKLLAREKELEKKLRAMEQQMATGAGGSRRADIVAKLPDGTMLIVEVKKGPLSQAGLRSAVDQLRHHYKSAIVALGSTDQGKVALVLAVTPDLEKKYDASQLIKQIAPIVGGSGGGRRDFAQAGGRDATKLEEALLHLETLLHAERVK